MVSLVLYHLYDGTEHLSRHCNFCAMHTRRVNMEPSTSGPEDVLPQLDSSSVH